MAREATLTVKKLVALTPEMAEAIADFRFAERLQSESDAIRRLIELGLQAAKASKT